MEAFVQHRGKKASILSWYCQHRPLAIQTKESLLVGEER